MLIVVHGGIDDAMDPFVVAIVVRRALFLYLIVDDDKEDPPPRVVVVAADTNGMGRNSMDEPCQSLAPRKNCIIVVEYETRGN